MRFLSIFASIVIVTPLLGNSVFAQSSGNEVQPKQQADGDMIREALGDDAAKFWIYEDVQAGFKESKRTGKPLLFSIR